ncbi:hypothetical protein SUGI_0179620 [Cryptomeria japonica]|nr:hypothetical protein SUGI_0179620 [Cryptomeria japonica]
MIMDSYLGEGHYHDGTVFSVFFHAIVQAMTSTEVGFQVENEMVAQAFWPKVADQIYEIGVGNLERPLSLFFGRSIAEDEDEGS